MLLENEHIRLRAVEPEDLDLLYRWENNPLYWYAGETRAPYSKYALKQHILDSAKDIYENKQLRLIIHSKQLAQAVGTLDLFGLDVFNSRIEVGLLIEDTFQQNGFASIALSLAREYVFNYLKINQMYAHVAGNNEASIKLFESRNFKRNGVLKDWIRNNREYVDVFVYQLFREK